MVTCADALDEALRFYGGEATSRQVFDYIGKHYPDKPWKDNTIRCHIMGCTVNHSSSHHYRHFRKFLYNLGPGHVRLYDPEKDGRWVWTPDGMKQVDQDDVVEEVTLEDDVEEFGDSVDSRQISLSMEKDLELFLYDDISVLDRSFILPDIENRQPKVASGFIDILAQDDSGAYVVIELKAGMAKDQALAQVLAYMSDVEEEFNTEVKGVIVAHEFSEKLVKASKRVNGVKLVKYKVAFEFEHL